MEDFIMQNFLRGKDIQKVACAVKNAPPVLFLVHKVTELLVSLPALQGQGKRTGMRRLVCLHPAAWSPGNLRAVL